MAGEKKECCMKKLFILLVVLGVLITFPSSRTEAQDAISGVIAAGIKKVIKAVDLKIQRLQTKTIWLQNAQKVVENKMAELHLAEISEWAEKQRVLYADYFDELWKVKNVISYYHRIKDITRTQLNLVEEYKRSYGLFKQDKHFSPEEISYMGNVYEGILNESVKNLDKLFVVINSFSTHMTDASRLKIIEGVANGIEENYRDLKTFDTENVLISLHRSKTESEADNMKRIYGIQ
jgi:hypothetical protein